MPSVVTHRDAAIFSLGGVIFGLLTYVIFGSIQPSWKRSEKPRSPPATFFNEISSQRRENKKDVDSNECKNPGLLVITGASRGIGLAVAELFAKEGWQVLNFSRGKCPHNAVVTRQIDLSHPDIEYSLAKYIREFIPQPRRICLVHNAATIFQDSALSVDIQAMRSAFQLNVFTPATLNKLISPLMSDGSSILYVGSTLSEKGIPERATYVSSKHAISGLMKVTCQDLKGRQIHTACICPGFTATEMLVQHLHSSPSAYASVLSMQTMGRLIEPYEIASFLYCCASTPSVNGGVLHCNLGQVER